MKRAADRTTIVQRLIQARKVRTRSTSRVGDLSHDDRFYESNGRGKDRTAFHTWTLT